MKAHYEIRTMYIVSFNMQKYIPLTCNFLRITFMNEVAIFIRKQVREIFLVFYVNTIYYIHFHYLDNKIKTNSLTFQHAFYYQWNVIGIN